VVAVLVALVRDGRLPPLGRQCQATVAGQMDRGVYWSPPHRCRNYARDNGYCPRHQPADRPAESSTDDDGPTHPSG
jgi:hypothetical protein